ncbi:hypothetical protein [Actinokineospora globicatena]|uniref:hypothetical protein n=1 Tax=Actinokineospora globicatena TaxID=103729 RepID=UPI0020A556DF|nr:hypothetical protein [Actinokineospora globicatena]MCP2302795.1 hypothetical protein [Actinokineospora globicatena]
MSKSRVALCMLVALVIAGGVAALAISLEFGSFWAKSLPVTSMVIIFSFAQSSGWLDKKVKDDAGDKG